MTPFVRSTTFFMLSALTALSLWLAFAPPPGSPYPPSRVIAGVEFDLSTHDRRAPGSDNWASTWAADDHIYVAWGDGGGFGGTNRAGRVSLGVARVEGGPSDYRGVNLWGGKDGLRKAAFGGKSYGILSLDGVLHMWFGPGSGVASYVDTRLATSTDHGLTWKVADWAFKKPSRLIMPTFCQFGKDYAGARDEYVYTYFVRHVGNPRKLQVHAPGAIDLARVHRDHLLDRARYEFFTGLDADGTPGWTADPERREAVFEDPTGVGWCFSVSYNPGLRRYFLATEHGATFKGNLGLFDAPEPWGPWTTVGYWGNWERLGSTFYANIPTKWISADGLDFTLIFTGVGKHDSWNTVRGRFLLHEAPNDRDN